MTIHLSKDAESTINAAVQGGLFASADEMVDRLVREYARRVPPSVGSPPAEGGRPIWEEILDLTAGVPDEEFDKLPADGAEQHDHYIYRHAEAAAGAMRRAFADAVYWIALANRKDQWHARVVAAMRSLGQASLVTTEEVLDEFLTYYGGHGPLLRRTAVQVVERAMANPRVTIRPQSHDSFQAGFALYKGRPDKEYSLTDCISMAAMREEGIAEILTHDNHFAQEGFTVLL